MVYLLTYLPFFVVGGFHPPDLSRSILNLGGLFAERQGWQRPNAGPLPVSSPPSEGISQPGVHFYRTTFNLDIPEGYDIPLKLEMPPIDAARTSVDGVYRALIFVNGWQFGKYVSYLGPQIVFPVPEGIFNHHGENTLGLILWALEPGGARISSLELTHGGIFQTGLGKIRLSGK